MSVDVLVAAVVSRPRVPCAGVGEGAVAVSDARCNARRHGVPRGISCVGLVDWVVCHVPSVIRAFYFTLTRVIFCLCDHVCRSYARARRGAVHVPLCRAVRDRSV